MNSHEDASYRLNLARGFLKEAEEDRVLKRWRACVSSAQLSAENSGKALLMLFGIAPKTHQPHTYLAKFTTGSRNPEDLRQLLMRAPPNFQSLGAEQHFLMDYGDEETYTLPWDLFSEDSAIGAISIARKCLAAVERIVSSVIQNIDLRE